MKKLIFVVLLALTSVLFINSNGFSEEPSRKYFDYDGEWKKVDSLLNHGLPKSALDVVSTIYQTSKSESNQPHYIKAVIYRTKIKKDIKEFGLENAIEEMRLEIPLAPFPSKNVLHSVLAELYWNYYTSNKYKFLNRSEVVNMKLEDIKTWDLKKIVEQVIENYKNSLIEIENLQNIKIDDYGMLLYKQSLTDYTIDGRKFRNTLYDILAHRAIDFFRSSEPDVIRPAEQFVLNDASYFDPAQDFVNLTINTNDTYSYKFYAVKLFQDLIKFHLTDLMPDAFVISDLKRLEFINANSAHPDKDSLYLVSLEYLENKFKDDPISADVSYQIAIWHYNKGLKYNAHLSDDNKWELQKAYEICSSTIDKYPGTPGAKNSLSLQNLIIGKNISLTFEETNPPNTPFKCLVTYKNINTVYFRVVETTPDEFEGLTASKPDDIDYYAYVINYYKEKKPVSKFSSNLPDDRDYQQHTAEMKIPELPLGNYIVLAGTDESMSYDKNAVNYAFINVTKISYISRTDEEGSKEFHLLNSISGEPIPGARIQVWDYYYDYDKQKYIKTRGEKLVTTNEGYFKVTASDKYRNFYLEIKTDDEEVMLSNYFYLNYIYKPYDYDAYTTIYYFTDRSIYRPGQQIYFKGIVLSTKNKSSEILKDFPVTIVFKDANYKEITSLELKTNEFGTVNGTFTAPTNGLLGKMTLSSSGTYGTAEVSVEEYKRPKFEVKVNDIQGSFRLNDMVKITGFAKAYSGANIDGASLKYRVVRKTFFPDWWWYWWGNYYKSADAEITSGTGTTNEKGEFEINFKAVPDLTVPKSANATYNYTVYVDVTDINGETRSATKYTSVGYVTLKINTDIPDNLNKNGNANYKIISRNLSGVYQPSSGKISVYRLKSPDKAYRNRLWERPDKYIYSKEEFNKYFPDDEYSDENNILKWEKENRILSFDFNTADDTSLILSGLNSWQAGKYICEIESKDSYEQDVKELKYFTVYSSDDKALPYPSLNWINYIKMECEPGENATFLAGSSANNLSALYELEREGKIIYKEWVKINSEQKFFMIPIKEEYIGNISMHFTYICNNRYYGSSSTIVVPYTNKKLDISFETFRNKLQPGEQDEWKIKIKDKKGDKVASEMVATLYDASLDAFKPHNWNFNIYGSYYAYRNWEMPSNLGTTSSYPYSLNWNPYSYGVSYVYDYLNLFGLVYGYYYEGYDYGAIMLNGNVVEQSIMTERSGRVDDKKEAPKSEKNHKKKGDPDEKDKEVTKGLKVTDEESGDTLENIVPPGIPLRANFNETAFFYPDLHTDENGELTIAFKIPESLTKWKMLGFAHTQDLKYGLTTNELVTQKDLMVNSNFPRFFREGDKISVAVKITNLSETDQKGQAQLQLFDGISMKPIDDLLQNKENVKSFETVKGQSTSVTYDLVIPDNVYAVVYRVYAKTDNFSDGEESTLPVLTNRMLVTETMPMPIRSNQTKQFKMQKLVENNSSTISNFKLTLEFTSNPAWYAIQALPYMMEYPWECIEQTFNRFYSNSIASHIANSNPKIKSVFDTWAKYQPDALSSNLEKNQELKTLTLENTPWVWEAQNESERKRRVAVLFEISRMTNELEQTIKKIYKAQLSNGAWTWFEGMPEDRFMTQYMVTGFGKLNHLGIKSIYSDNRIWSMTTKAVNYMDREIEKDYEGLLEAEKKGWIKLSDDNLGYYAMQYLYARSFFLDVTIPKSSQVAFDYYFGQAKKYWLNKGKFLQGMLALSMYRFEEKTVPMDIIKSLKEYAIYDDEFGMYWKQNYGYYWYEAPIEFQALMIELFDEVAKDNKAVDDLRVWLLKQKQTTDWKTTKATADACYALLLEGSDWLATEVMVDITVGSQKIDPLKMEDVKVEAGTGYFKTSWKGLEISNDMGNVTVVKKNEGVSWGALYWQYFEDLDKIISAESPLSIKKNLFLKQNTSSGPVITPIDENITLKPGDMVISRVEIRTDRNLEYVHLRDMRASCFEPTNVLSQYKYQDNLGYYESTRDASTDFFFGYIPKGTYVFEYPLIVSHKGDFSNGIAVIQCLYAPEFAAHSAGIRVKVSE